MPKGGGIGLIRIYYVRCSECGRLHGDDLLGIFRRLANARARRDNHTAQESALRRNHNHKVFIIPRLTVPRDSPPLEDIDGEFPCPEGCGTTWVRFPGARELRRHLGDRHGNPTAGRALLAKIEGGRP